MVPPTRSRGYTLLETIMAMAVLTIGAMGTMSVFRQGEFFHADTRSTSRATALAQDLMANIDLWPYDAGAGPLANTTASNDATLGDPAHLFETSADPLADGLADHGEADLPADFRGVPAADLAAAYGTTYQRFWSVAAPANAAGVVEAMRVAVVVRWPVGGRWHRVVLLSAKPNPVR